MYTEDMDLFFSEFGKTVVIVITIQMQRKHA